MELHVIASSFVNLVSSAYLWMLMFIAIFVGMFFGAVPGLSGLTGLAIMLPFTIYMDIWSALFFITGAGDGAIIAVSFFSERGKIPPFFFMLDSHAPPQPGNKICPG